MWTIAKKQWAEERIFIDLAMINSPQDNGIIVTNKNWHIMVDQDNGSKEWEFYGTKTGFVELKDKKFSKQKNIRKQVTYITIMHLRIKF